MCGPSLIKTRIKIRGKDVLVRGDRLRYAGEKSLPAEDFVAGLTAGEIAALRTGKGSADLFRADTFTGVLFHLSTDELVRKWEAQGRPRHGGGDRKLRYKDPAAYAASLEASLGYTPGSTLDKMKACLPLAEECLPPA